MDGLQEGEETKRHTFSFENYIFKYRFIILSFLCGLILLGLGVFYYKVGGFVSGYDVEVLEEATGPQDLKKEVVVEVAGAVANPGVYKLFNGSRVEDLLILSGGLSADADSEWVGKMVNRAAVLKDGQKLYIPRVGEISKQQTLGQSAENSRGGENLPFGDSAVIGRLININTASQKQLEGLPGIGPVYAQNIIEQRPYSTVDELLTRKVLKKSVYEKIKELVVVY